MTKSDFKNMAFFKPWINDKGLVDYEAIKKDQWFEEQVQRLESTDLAVLNHQEKFAFWLNAYNLLTVKGVLMSLERNPHWKGNTSLLNKIRFFYMRKFSVAGKKISLANIENKILRKSFKDPRIHFAINCASKSCPILPGRLFKADFLDEYLEQLTINFINNKDHVFCDKNKNILYLNPIFKWYKKDFQVKGGVREFIANYRHEIVKCLKESKIQYLTYNWEINSQ